MDTETNTTQATQDAISGQRDLGNDELTDTIKRIAKAEEEGVQDFVSIATVFVHSGKPAKAVYWAPEFGDREGVRTCEDIAKDLKLNEGEYYSIAMTVIPVGELMKHTTAQKFIGENN